MFLQASVILLTGGGVTSPPQEQTPLEQTTPREETLPEQTPPSPPESMLWDTVNAQTVRILL